LNGLWEETMEIDKNIFDEIEEVDRE